MNPKAERFVFPWIWRTCEVLNIRAILGLACLFFCCINSSAAESNPIRINGYFGIKWLGIVGVGASVELMEYAYLDYTYSYFGERRMYGVFHHFGGGVQYPFRDFVFRLGLNRVSGKIKSFDGQGVKGISVSTESLFLPFKYGGFKVGGSYYFTEKTLFLDKPDSHEIRKENFVGGSLAIVLRY